MDCAAVSLHTTKVQMSTGVTHDTESVPEPLTNLRFSDLYNFPGESVPMNSEIFCAMRADNRELLEKMKSYETPMVCFKNDDGDTILHVAASFGHLELVESIISECPSLLLEPNWKGRIPLHVAARAGRTEVVKVLAASIECSYVAEDINGDTPLHLAMKYLQEETEHLLKRIRMRGFLSRVFMYSLCSSKEKYFSDASRPLAETAIFLVSANPCLSFLANEDESPLYLAVKAGNLSLVNAMLSHEGNSSNFASQLKGRKSLVHVALKAKNIDVLDVILKEFPTLVNERDEDGQTCLSVGASVGFYKGICKLLDRSTSSVFECNIDGSYPIHKAVEQGHANVVKLFLKRCPDSAHQLNKQGQNVFHIAAKSGNTVYYLMNYIRFDTRKHLMEEQDVDGNTPLHLATLNLHPRAIERLTRSESNKKKYLYIENKDGLRPLDIAQDKLQSEYIFRERMTLMVLLCVYKPKGVSWIPTSGMTLVSKPKKKDDDDEKLKDQQYEKFKDRVNVLLLMAALVATMTFAAGFTMPGGFNSSAPNMGMAILVNDIYLSDFLVCDTLAMQFSLVAIVALVWAQLGDQELARKAFHLALPSLFIALCFMSYAFMIGIQATTKENKSLTKKINIITSILTNVMIILLTPYVIPQLHGIPVIEFLTRMYLVFLLELVNEGDAEELYTFGSDHNLGFITGFIVQIKDRFFWSCFK